VVSRLPNAYSSHRDTLANVLSQILSTSPRHDQRERDRLEAQLLVHARHLLTDTIDTESLASLAFWVAATDYERGTT
jgi:hypothetical protein